MRHYVAVQGLGAPGFATSLMTSLMTGSTIFSVALGVATSGSAALYWTYAIPQTFLQRSYTLNMFLIHSIVAGRKSIHATNYTKRVVIILFFVFFIIIYSKLVIVYAFFFVRPIIFYLWSITDKIFFFLKFIICYIIIYNL